MPIQFVTIQIPAEVHKALKVQAEAEDRSVSKIATRILSEALNVGPSADAEAVRRSL